MSNRQGTLFTSFNTTGDGFRRGTSLGTFRLCYLLTPWCRVLLEKLTGLQLVKEFPAFHGTRRFITAFTSVRELSGVAKDPVHIPTSHLLEIRPNIIYPYTPISPQWSPYLWFPHQDPIQPLSSPIRATCPAHLILLDFITRTILVEEYKSFSSSLCILLHSPFTSSLLDPNILPTPCSVLKHPQLPFLPQCQRLPKSPRTK